jgi:hypothetical protein
MHNCASNASPLSGAATLGSLFDDLLLATHGDESIHSTLHLRQVMSSRDLHTNSGLWNHQSQYQPKLHVKIID